MTSTSITVRRQAIAVQRALEFAEMLDPRDEPLQLAKNEPFPADQYVLAEVVATLGRVCLQQQKQIKELAEMVEAHSSGDGTAKE